MTNEQLALLKEYIDARIFEDRFRQPNKESDQLFSAILDAQDIQEVPKND